MVPAVKIGWPPRLVFALLIASGFGAGACDRSASSTVPGAGGNAGVTAVGGSAGMGATGGSGGSGMIASGGDAGMIAAGGDAGTSAGGDAGMTALGGSAGSNEQGGSAGGGLGGGGAVGAGGTIGIGGQGGDTCPLTGPFAMTGCPEVSGAPLGVASHPNEGANHVVVCSTTCYETNPPSSGNHYPVWPVYKTYADPVPWGFLVHGLEHGAIIVSYNCPCGCADEVAAAQAWIDALPLDEVCQPSQPPRVVLAPDPTLDVHWAASAWTWTLRAETFAPAAFQAFFLDHYNHGGEVVCSGGADGSITGWCQ